MKTFRLIAAAALLTAISILPAYAQGGGAARPAQRPAATPAAPAADNGPVPVSTIALIDTDAFSDEKQGITRLVAAVKKVDAEFTPRRTDLQGLQARIKGINDDIAKTKDVADPRTLQTKKDQADQLQRELDFKAQGAQADYNKRLQEVVGPIYDDIGKALDDFARRRNITLMLDAAKIGPAIITAAPTMNVTGAFITEYNSRPATASATTP
jgi:Skp family chaperone for outer membrane proteins